MNCQHENCSLAATQRKGFSGLCHKHAYHAKGKDVMEKINVIPKMLLNGDFVLCFPDEPAPVDHILTWTLEEGHSAISYAEYLFGVLPRSNYQVKRFLELEDRYKTMYHRTAVEVHRWTLEQRKLAWGLTAEGENDGRI